MAATIKIKNSSTAGAAPTSSDLVQGELAVNVTDKRLFTENASGTVVELGTNPSTLTVTAGATIQGLTVGKGAGAVSTNTAVGASALAANTSGNQNIAIGISALTANTTGADNTAVGRLSSFTNTTGNSNTALGSTSLAYNTTGSNNTAIGYRALQENTTASNNTAVGYQAGYSNTTGTSVTAAGYLAAYANTTGASITAFGYQAGKATTTSNSSTYIGSNSGLAATGAQNTFLGQGSGEAITSGAKNTIIGRYDGNTGGLDIRTASNYIVLSDGDGNPRGVFDGNGDASIGAVSTTLASRLTLKSRTTDSSTNILALINSASTEYFRVRSDGYTYAQGVYANTSASAANVFVSSGGDLLRSTSALKYKQDIRDLEEMDISLLRPVRYKSKCESDDQTKDHLGVIADEAADAGFEELITRGVTGEVEGFQYERLTIVLLKSLQSLKAEFDAYKATHP